METFARFAHITSLGIWTGATLFLFVLAPAVFAALPKSTAGEAMNAIFPRFYAVCSVCAALALATAFLLPERTATRLGFLVATAGLLIVAAYVLGPQATGLRLAVLEAEAAESSGRPAPELKELRSRFGKLHGAIMAVDLAMLVGSFGLLWVSLAPLSPMSPKMIAALHERVESPAR